VNTRRFIHNWHNRGVSNRWKSHVNARRSETWIRHGDRE
jgi:hypothetical protein